MIEFEEQKLKLEGYRKEVESLEGALDIARPTEEIAELEAQTTAPGFWDDQSRSGEILKKISNKKNKVEMAEKIRSQFEDLLTLIEMADEEEDLSLYSRYRAYIYRCSPDPSSARLLHLL